MYTRNVDFYVANISDWIESQFRLKGLQDKVDKSFLDHAILDMPDAEQHATRLAAALRPDGKLIVFNPSITQIVQSLEHFHGSQLPFVLDQVLELGHGLTGGRVWDLRVVESKLKAQWGEDSNDTSGPPTPNDGDASVDGHDVSRIAQMSGHSRPKIVCRPLVGDRVRGGGFLAVWKKLKR